MSHAPNSLLTRYTQLALVALAISGCAEPTAVSGQTSMTETEPPSFLLKQATVFSRDRPEGGVRLVRGENLSLDLENVPDYQRALSNQHYGELALMFLKKYGASFRLSHPDEELTVSQVHQDDLGYRQIRLAQHYRGIPIVGAEILLHFSPENHIYMIQGRYIPTPEGLSIEPQLNMSQAMSQLSALLGDGLTISDGNLVIFPLDLTSARLAYQFQARRNLTEGSHVIVDANNGAVLRDTPIGFEGR